MRYVRHVRRAALLLLIVFFPGCPPPTPTPTPSPTPTPTPTPVACECVVPSSEDQGWQSTTVEGPPIGEVFVRSARDLIGDRCDKDKNETLALVAAKLKGMNVCAAGPWADADLLARPDGLWEEWHVIEWQRGCWYPLSKAFKGYWKHPSASACM